jgi:hypothetical protein
MVRAMIMRPLRAGVCATRLGVHVTTRVAAVALGITRAVIGASLPAQSHAGPAGAEDSSSTFELDVVITSSSPLTEAAPQPPPESSEGTLEAVPTAPEVLPAPEVPPTPETRAAPDLPPTHVSEGLQFVEAFAEPGAEEGAGAAVHVREPWRGYSEMTASEVILRLPGTSPEELAAVALYEGVHRRRKTVLTEARRQLRSATARTSAAQARRA